MFVDRLTELIGIPSVGQPVKASPAPKKETAQNALASIESVTRRHSPRHRASQSVTCDEQPALNWGVGSPRIIAPRVRSQAPGRGEPLR